MINIFFKKAFYGSWDNFYKLFIINIPVTAVIIPSLYFVFLASSLPVVAIPLSVIMIFIMNLYFGVVAGSVSALLLNDEFNFKKYLSFFRISFRPAVMLTFIWIVVSAVFMFVIPFYMKIGGMAGMVASSIIFWASIMWLFASQFYWPLFYLLKDKRGKVLKKCFLIFFDNKALSLLLGVITLTYSIISVFIAFLLPGFSFILYLQTCAVNMLISKYDYIASLSELEKTAIKELPWKTILEKDFSDLENRTLKGMIFPWKE